MNKEWINKSKKYENKSINQKDKDSGWANMIVDTSVPLVALGGIATCFKNYFTFGGLELSSSVISKIGMIGGISLPMVSVGTVGCGAFYAVYRILTKDSRYKKAEYLNNLNMWNGFFNEIGMENGDNDMPIFIYDIIKENKRTIKFEVPNFITKSAFASKKKLIEEYLGVDKCKITFKDNFAYIKIIYYNELDKKFSMLFDNINVKNSMNEKPEFVYSKSIPHGIRGYYTIPDGISSKLTEQQFVKVKTTFDCETVRTGIEGDMLILDIITERLLSNIPYEKPTIKDKTKLQIAFGHDLDGVVYATFDEANGHMLIGGESGSGKSCACRVSLVSLVQGYTKEYVRLWIADFKQVELYSFAHTHITDRFATEIDEICRMILDLEDEMRRRYELFKEYRVNDIRTYNKKVKKKDRLYRIVFYIEEIAILFQMDKKYKIKIRRNDEDIVVDIKEVWNSLVQEGQQARACGIHIWTTIQRPSKDSFDPRLKANLSTRFCLSCADEVNSRLILGDDDSSASQLRGNGHAIIKNGEGKRELQTYYIPHEELDNILYDYLTEEGKSLVDIDRKRTIENLKN